MYVCTNIFKSISVHPILAFIFTYIIYSIYNIIYNIIYNTIYTLLGRLLQRRYLADPNNPEALALRDVDRIYRPGTVFSRSTNVDQTIASADALLQGFYPPTGINYDTGLTSGYQSIPVHSISAQLDNLIGAYRVCPTLNTEINKFFNSKDFKV